MPEFNHFCHFSHWPLESQKHPMSTTLPQVQKRLRHAGFVEVRCSGSHHTYQSPTGARIQIAHHGKGTRFTPGTLAAIEKDIAKQLRAGVAVQQAMRTPHQPAARQPRPQKRQRVTSAA